MPVLPKNKKLPWENKRKSFAKSSKGDPFYHSVAWRRLRKWYIIRNPLCVECKKKGILKQANVVDHIKPISQGGEKLNVNNLQGLCTSCHNRKSGREAHKCL